MSEEWEKWDGNCSFKLERKYDFHGLVDDHSGLTLYLADSAGTFSIKVYFPGGVIAYRCSEELAYLETLDTIRDNEGNSVISAWTFFLVKNSKYIESVVREGRGIYTSDALVHIAVLSGTGIFEAVIFANELPQISVWDMQNDKGILNVT